MIKNYITIISAVLMMLAASAQADVTLKDSSEIVGKWAVTAEASKIDGEKKAVKVEWDFTTNGVLHTIATDSVGRTKEMKIDIKYSVENGEIKKQSKPGQEKYES